MSDNNDSEDNASRKDGDSATSSFITKSSPDKVEIKGSNKGSNKLSRNLKTVGLALGFYLLGFDLLIYGLSLPTLAENLQKRVSEISIALAARGAGFLLGSVAVNFTKGRLNIELALSISMCLMSVSIAFVPSILNFPALIVFSFLSSFGLGAFETLGNVFCIKLWGDQAQTVLQTMHFFFCLGSVSMPLASKPFINEAQNSTENNGTEIFRDVIYVGDTNLPYLSVIYIITGLIGFLLAIYFLFLNFAFKTVSNVVDGKTIEDKNKSFRYKIMALTFVLFVLYVGVYLSVNSFLYTFAVSNIPGAGYSKDGASNLSTMYLIGDAVGQFFSIFMAKKFTATFNLRLNLTTILGCSFGLLFFPYYTEYKPIFWVLLAIHGLFLPSVYGYLFSWANDYITVDERASSIFIIGGSLGEMLLPLLLGLVIDDNPMYFLYAIFLYIVLTFVLFLCATTFAGRYGTKKERNKEQNRSKELLPQET